MPYIKEAFDVTTFEQAKNVVLSSDPTDPSKFDSETQYLIKVIEQNVNINNNSTVLDFGCGMGRISNELIVRFNCKVVGVDISPSMLTFALLYTANMNKFTPLTDYSVEDSIDCALSIFVLQHCQDPQKEIDNIGNFDIALIGAGCYSLLLCAYIKNTKNRIAFHLGGGLQMMFGVYGARWDISNGFFKEYVNNYWIRPNENETPANFKNQEFGAYF